VTSVLLCYWCTYAIDVSTAIANAVAIDSYTVAIAAAAVVNAIDTAAAAICNA
jgi:hypothetical protein